MLKDEIEIQKSIKEKTKKMTRVNSSWLAKPITRVTR
jgi:hypothetical protein